MVANFPAQRREDQSLIVKIKNGWQGLAKEGGDLRSKGVCHPGHASSPKSSAVSTMILPAPFAHQISACFFQFYRTTSSKKRIAAGDPERGGVCARIHQRQRPRILRAHTPASLFLRVTPTLRGNQRNKFQQVCFVHPGKTKPRHPIIPPKKPPAALRETTLLLQTQQAF